MKRTTLLITLLTLLTMTACNPVEPVTPDIPDTPGTPDTPGEPTATVTYSDLTIDSFSYPAVPAEGGTVTPELQYSYVKTTTWSDGRTEQKTLTSDAEVSYTGTATVDTDGNVTLPANIDFTQKEFSVTVTVKIGKTDANATATVYQDERSSEDDMVVSSETVQLPLCLTPHKCVYPAEQRTNFGGFRVRNPETGELIASTEEYSYDSESEDGIIPRDVFKKMGGWSPQNDIAWPLEGQWAEAYPNIWVETVSVKGASIGFTGGELVRIDTYESGKKDTIILALPSYTTDVTFQVRPNEVNGVATANEDPSQRPLSTISGKFWNISAPGYEEYNTIMHTLTATVEGRQTSVSLWQHDNPIVEEVPYPYEKEYTFWEFDCPRITEPYPAEIEDYPPGSNPKWMKAMNRKGEITGPWINPAMTKSLHADSDRIIAITMRSKYRLLRHGERKYLSGAVRPAYQIEKKEAEGGNSRMEFNVIYAKVTISGTAKYKDGKTEKITHTYEWNKLYHSQNLWFCVPVVENLAVPFTWTVSLDNFVIADDPSTMEWRYDNLNRPKPYMYTTNWSSFSKNVTLPVTWQIEERLASINDWLRQVPLGGNETGGFLSVIEHDYWVDGVKYFYEVIPFEEIESLADVFDGKPVDNPSCRTIFSYFVESEDSF